MSISVMRGFLRRLAADVLRQSTIKAAAEIGAKILPRTTIRNAFKAIAINTAADKAVMNDVEFVVYYGEPQAQSHFDMWNPVFAPLAGRYVTVFRYAEPWWGQRNDKRVLPVSNIAQSETLFARCPNLKAIFYPANNGVNLQAVRHTEYQHVFLGHGDSNKASSANKAFRLYDEVWIAGPAHQDRFTKIPGRYDAIDFRIVGQPWMQAWLRERPNYTAEMQVDWGYFPTWRGYYKDTNYSSLSQVANMTKVARRFAGTNSKGWFKLHPWTSAADYRVTMAQASECSDIAVMNPSARLQEALHKPLRFVICDVSAAVTECLYINVPIFLYRPGAPAILSPDFDRQNTFCYMFRDEKELEALMERVLIQHDDFLEHERAAALRYLVDVEKTRGGQFYEEVERLSKLAPARDALS